MILTGYSRRCRCYLVVVDRYKVAFALEGTALVAQKLCALTKPPCNDDLALSLFRFSDIAHITISSKSLPRFLTYTKNHHRIENPTFYNPHVPSATHHHPPRSQ